ncbi:unnamed protein product, partial [Ixodes pacificus]
VSHPQYADVVIVREGVEDVDDDVASNLLAQPHHGSAPVQQNDHVFRGRGSLDIPAHAQNRHALTDRGQRLWRATGRTKESDEPSATAEELPGDEWVNHAVVLEAGIHAFGPLDGVQHRCGYVGGHVDGAVGEVDVCVVEASVLVQFHGHPVVGIFVLGDLGHRVRLVQLLGVEVAEL